MIGASVPAPRSSGSISTGLGTSTPLYQTSYQRATTPISERLRMIEELRTMEREYEEHPVILEGEVGPPPDLESSDTGAGTAPKRDHISDLQERVRRLDQAKRAEYEQKRQNELRESYESDVALRQSEARAQREERRQQALDQQRRDEERAKIESQMRQARAAALKKSTEDGLKETLEHRARDRELNDLLNRYIERSNRMLTRHRQMNQGGDQAVFKAVPKPRTRAERLEGRARHSAPSHEGLFECRPGQPGYISPQDQFKTDTAADIRAQQHLRYEQQAAIRERRTQATAARNAEMARREEASYQRQVANLERRQDPRRPHHNKSNYEAIDIVTHEYTTAEGARQQRYVDAATVWRSEQRSRRIYECGNNSYDPVTGEQRQPYPPPRPPPDPTQFGLMPPQNVYDCEDDSLE